MAGMEDWGVRESGKWVGGRSPPLGGAAGRGGGCTHAIGPRLTQLRAAPAPVPREQPPPLPLPLPLTRTSPRSAERQALSSHDARVKRAASLAATPEHVNVTQRNETERNENLLSRIYLSASAGGSHSTTHNRIHSYTTYFQINCFRTEHIFKKLGCAWLKYTLRLCFEFMFYEV